MNLVCKRGPNSCFSDLSDSVSAVISVPFRGAPVFVFQSICLFVYLLDSQQNSLSCWLLESDFLIPHCCLMNLGFPVLRENGAFVLRCILNVVSLRKSYHRYLLEVLTNNIILTFLVFLYEIAHNMTLTRGRFKQEFHVLCAYNINSGCVNQRKGNISDIR